LGDLLAQVGFGGLLELAEDHGRDLGRGILLAANVDPGVAVVTPDDFIGDHLHFFADFFVAPPHEALNGEDRVFGVGNGLALGHLADQPFPGLGEAHHGGGGSGTLLVGDNGGLPGLHDGDYGVRRTEVDAYDFAHVREAS